MQCMRLIASIALTAALASAAYAQSLAGRWAIAGETLDNGEKHHEKLCCYSTWQIVLLPWAGRITSRPSEATN